MRLIILVAGQGLILDGMIKCLIRNPKTGKSILAHLVEAFDGCEISVVVGYRAVEIMQEFPALHYVYNAEWAVTGSAYSLALALDDRPSYVISGDLLFDAGLVKRLDAAGGDFVVTRRKENRNPASINCIIDGERVAAAYIGPLRDAAHEEAVGLFKISDPDVLGEWKRRSLDNGNLFAGQTLPLEMRHIGAVSLHSDEYLAEINTVNDYMNILKELR